MKIIKTNNQQSCELTDISVFLRVTFKLMTVTIKQKERNEETILTKINLLFNVGVRLG